MIVMAQTDTTALAQAGRDAFHEALAAAVEQWAYDNPDDETDVCDVEAGIIAGIAAEVASHGGLR